LYNFFIYTQATEELTLALKNPQTYVILCTLIGTSKDDKLKEYAALVLRKKLYKRNAWMNVSQEVRQQYESFKTCSYYFYLLFNVSIVE
jgi:hypothetical protein